MHADNPLTALADLQHNVAHVSQLAAAGLSRGAVSRRCLGGQLTRIHPSVYALGRAELTPEGELLAAVLSVPPPSLLSHGSALSLWTRRARGGGPTHVTSPKPRRSRPGLAAHRATSLHPDDLCALDFIPLTAPARSLLDFAVAGDVGELERALNALRAARLVGPSDLGDLRGRTFGHHGWKALGRLIAGDAGAGFSREEAELRLWHLIRDAGLPRPLRNHRLHGWEVDAYWPDAGLVVEVDSWDFHSSRDAFERDRRKQSELQDHGLEVLRFTWRQLTGQPLWVAARIAGRLAARR